jgi:hypothetical protein
MNNIRAKFEEIWPVPAGIEWDDRWSEYLPIDPADGHLIDQCTQLDTRLDTFTRCQETTEVYVSLIDELVQSLQWYVDEDEIHEGDPENKYWVDGKHEAEALLERVKQITGAKE